MRACWVALVLAIFCAFAIIIIGSIGYNGGVNEKKLIQLREQNEELEFFLQEERDRVEELEGIINRSGSFTISVEIR